MEKRNLGATGLKVSRLAMGGFFTSSFGGGFDQSKEAIGKALDLNINYFDTAPNYGNSEEVLGKSFRQLELPKDIIISTKIGGKPQPFLPQDRDCLMRSIEESLKKLGRDYIDILMIHEPDRPGQYDWWTNHEACEGPVLDLLGDLKRQGIIKHIGAAGTTVYEMKRVIESKKFDVLLTAFNYNLLFREAEEWLMPEAIKQGMGVVIGSPLQMGALANCYEEEIESGARWMSPPRRAQFKALYQLSKEKGMTLPEMGLRFLLFAPGVSCVLTGAKSAEEVENNVAIAGKGPLDTELLGQLAEIARMVPYRPFEEPFAMPFDAEYKGPGLVNSSRI